MSGPVKMSYYLDAKTANKFSSVCKQTGLPQTRVIDSLIAAWMANQIELTSLPTPSAFGVK